MRLVSALVHRTPSVSTMTPERLVSIQATPAPALLAGRIRRGVQVRQQQVPGPDGEITVRVHVPSRSGRDGLRPLVLQFHGGGWVFGTAQGTDWMCSTVAHDVDAVVVSVDYRLAPVHPFPAGLEDCYAALLWAAENAAVLGADATRIGVMGESAGGNLAAVTALLARERSGPAIRHQALLYPATDGSMSTDSYRVNSEAPIVTAENMKDFYRYYLGGADPLDPRVSPLHAASHAGLPPATIAVAAHDPLRDDGVLYARALQAAGVPVTLEEYPAMPHGFANFPYFNRESRRALNAVTRDQRASFA